MSSRVWLAVLLLALFAVGCTDAPDAGTVPTDTPTPTGTPDEAIDPDSTATVESLEWARPTSNYPDSVYLAIVNQPYGIEYNIWQHGRHRCTGELDGRLKSAYYPLAASSMKPGIGYAVLM